jgi:hypothetical protein
MTGDRNMDQQHLEKLSPDVRDFVLSTECKTKIKITVIEDPKRNECGHDRKGTLCCNVTPNSITICAPTTGYFPDGGVVHEVLHARRLLIDKVPRLAEPENHPWDSVTRAAMTNLDNALEHLFIIPEELNKRPERREYWHEQLRHLLLQDLQLCQDKAAQRQAAAIYWMLLKLVLAEPRTCAEVKLHLENLGLLNFANNYLNDAVIARESKEQLTKKTFDFFNIPRYFANFEYYEFRTRTSISIDDL